MRPKYDPKARHPMPILPSEKDRKSSRKWREYLGPVDIEATAGIDSDFDDTTEGEGLHVTPDRNSD
jgi:hypothetical protein